VISACQLPEVSPIKIDYLKIAAKGYTGVLSTEEAVQQIPKYIA
jgi:hypothetical protein